MSGWGAGGALRKTAQGVEEIAKRALGLSPLARRALILVDGQRDASALRGLMGGHAIEPLLAELLDKGCIEPAAALAEAPAAAAQVEQGPADWPVRTAAQLDMGRHFLVNTLATFTGPYAHADLMSEATRAEGQAELRALVPAWRAAMEVVVSGKRLAQLEADLLKVI